MPGTRAHRDGFHADWRSLEHRARPDFHFRLGNGSARRGRGDNHLAGSERGVDFDFPFVEKKRDSIEGENHKVQIRDCEKNLVSRNFSFHNERDRKRDFRRVQFGLAKIRRRQLCGRDDDHAKPHAAGLRSRAGLHGRHKPDNQLQFRREKNRARKKDDSHDDRDFLFHDDSLRGFAERVSRSGGGGFHRQHGIDFARKKPASDIFRRVLDFRNTDVGAEDFRRARKGRRFGFHRAFAESDFANSARARPASLFRRDGNLLGGACRIHFVRAHVRHILDFGVQENLTRTLAAGEKYFLESN